MKLENIKLSILQFNDIKRIFDKKYFCTTTDNKSWNELVKLRVATKYSTINPKKITVTNNT